MQAQQYRVQHRVMVVLFHLGHLEIVLFILTNKSTQCQSFMIAVVVSRHSVQ